VITAVGWFFGYGRITLCISLLLFHVYAVHPDTVLDAGNQLLLHNSKLAKLHLESLDSHAACVDTMLTMHDCMPIMALCQSVCGYGVAVKGMDNASMHQFCERCGRCYEAYTNSTDKVVDNFKTASSDVLAVFSSMGVNTAETQQNVSRVQTKALATNSFDKKTYTGNLLEACPAVMSRQPDIMTVIVRTEANISNTSMAYRLSNQTYTALQQDEIAALLASFQRGAQMEREKFDQRVDKKRNNTLLNNYNAWNKKQRRMLHTMQRIAKIQRAKRDVHTATTVVDAVNKMTVNIGVIDWITTGLRIGMEFHTTAGFFKTLKSTMRNATTAFELRYRY